MVNSEIKTYIIRGLKEGFEKDVLESNLLENGWQKGDIDDVLEDEDVKSLLSIVETIPSPNDFRDEPKKDVEEEVKKKKQKKLEERDISNPLDIVEEKEVETEEITSDTSGLESETEIEDTQKELSMIEKEGMEVEEKTFDAISFNKTVVEEKEKLPEIKPLDPKGDARHSDISYLRSYAGRCLKKGFGVGVIRKVVLDAGWSEETIDQVFNDPKIVMLVSNR